MTTPSNTITFGDQKTVTGNDYTITNDPNYIALNKALATHKLENTNDKNSKYGFGRGLRAFMQAVDIVIKVDEAWAYEILWKYFKDNAAHGEACSEEVALRGGEVVTEDITKYVTVYNLYRPYTKGYTPTTSEATFVRNIGSPEIVLWVEARYAEQ